MRAPKEPKRLEKKVTQISEEDRIVLIDLVSRARALFNNRYTAPDEITKILNEIEPYAKRAREEGHYLFSVIVYHNDRLKGLYKEKAGHKYRAKPKS